MKIYIANAKREDVAKIGQDLGLSGTVYDATGFGAWGIEPTVVIETDHAQGLFSALFRAYPNEQALWVDFQNPAVLPGEIRREHLVG